MVIKRAIKKIRKTLFFEVFGTIKKNKKMSVFLVLLDVAFFLILFGLNSLVKSLRIDVFWLFVLVVLQAVFVVVVYSFFKYIALKLVSSFVERSELDFEKFGQFFLFNLVIVIFGLLVFFVINLFFSYLVKPAVFPVVAYVIFLLYSLFFYLAVNMGHFIFIKELNIKKSIKKTFEVVFKRGKSYVGIILGSVFFFFMFYMVLIIGLILARIFIFKTEETLINYFIAFESFMRVFMFLFVYFLIFFNRIYFKLIVKKTNL